MNKRKRSVSVTTRQSTIQAAELENRYNEEARRRKEAEEALAGKNEELEVMKRLHKEEQDTLQLQTQALEQKHQDELRLRKDTEYVLSIEREWIQDVKLQLETKLLKAMVFESKYYRELRLRKHSESAVDKERNELEATKQLLETCNTKQENLNSQVRTWQEKHDQESSLRKETEDALSREKQVLETVKGLLGSSNKETDAMRQERDNALALVEEITTKLAEERQPPPSFVCPISQEVMKDPHLTADGHSYEAEDIRTWFSTGHDTSPLTNLKLPHCNLVPNRALRSAIQDLV